MKYMSQKYMTIFIVRLVILFLFYVTTIVVLQAAPIDNEPTPFTAGAYTMVIFPDIQRAVADVYAPGGAEEDPEQLKKYIQQIDWIIANKTSRNIIFVFTVGDNANNNSTPEWERFYGENRDTGAPTNSGMANLIDNDIPVGVALGNHDYALTLNNTGKPAIDRGGSRLEEYFSDADLYAGLQNGASDWGYFSDPEDSKSRANTYSKFTAPDGKYFLFLNIEFGPRDIVLDWANGIAYANSNHYIIMATHAYEYPNAYKDFKGLRYTGYDNEYQKWAPHHYHYHGSYGWQSPPSPYPTYPFSVVNDLGYPAGYEGNDGQEIWEKLVNQHSNIKIVSSGHVSFGDSFGRAESIGINGNIVHEMLSNYQECDDAYCGTNGHSSYLRILEFQPDGETVRVKTYSPYMGKWMDDIRNNFSIQFSTLSIPSKTNYIAVDGVPVFFD